MKRLFRGPAARLFLVAPLFALQPVFAQEPPDAAAGVQSDGAVTTYGEDFFGPYNAINAEDILRRIPGIQEILRAAQAQGANTNAAQVRRGFGSSGDQILINGRRLSGKSNDIASALQRIQAGQVREVQVIRGTVPGLDVRSEGTVVNVVLKEVMVTGTGSWEGGLTHYTGGRVKPGGKLSYSGEFGALAYIVGVTATPFLDIRDRTDFFFLPGSQPFAQEDEKHSLEGTYYVGTANLTYTFVNGDILNLNGRYADQGLNEREPSYRYSLSPAGAAYTGLFTTRRDLAYTTWEMGGDYEHAFAGGDTLKALFLYNVSSQRDDKTFFSEPPGTAETLDRTQLQLPDRTEKILRATYRWGITQTQSLEFGGEAAVNTLDQSIEQFRLMGGALVQTPLFNPDAKVNERRLESVATYAWQPVQVFQLEAALDTESSRLRQRGRDVNRTRSFFFVKPRLDLRYDAAPLTQMRARAQRTISQLNFADFVSGFIADDNRNDAINAGNPDLVPEKTWIYELTAEQRLSGDRGVFSLKGFYNDIADHIEKIAAGDGSATGNIGDAEIYGVEAKAAFRLGFLGLPGASVDATATVRRSSTTDPFTGEKRDIWLLSDEVATVNFRHDTAWRSLAYGFTWTYNSVNYNYDYDFFHAFKRKQDVDAFAEFRPLAGITLRFEGKRLLRGGLDRDRWQYVGSRGDGVLLRAEQRRTFLPRELSVVLRGTF